MRLLGRLFGELHWTPPEWGRRLGLRKFGLVAGGVVALAALLYAGYAYYASLPQPTRVVAQVPAPGITPIVDGELRPEPLTLDFSVVADPRLALLTVDSVARLDLIGTTLTQGIALEPALLSAEMFVAFSKKSPCKSLAPQFGEGITQLTTDGSFHKMLTDAIAAWDAKNTPKE